MKLVGNTPGGKVLKLGDATKTGQFGPHIITTGVINLYEGVTVSFVALSTIAVDSCRYAIQKS